MSELDKVFNTTISQHGYWLINNRDVVEKDIDYSLRMYGFSQTVKYLNDYNSDWVQILYRDIEYARNHNEVTA